MDVISPGQFSLVYNAFSLTIAVMGAATVFFFLSRSQVSAPYRTALTVTGLAVPTFLSANAPLPTPATLTASPSDGVTTGVPASVATVSPILGKTLVRPVSVMRRRRP